MICSAWVIIPLEHCDFGAIPKLLRHTTSVGAYVSTRLGRHRVEVPLCWPVVLIISFVIAAICSQIIPLPYYRAQKEVSCENFVCAWILLSDTNKVQKYELTIE